MTVRFSASNAARLSACPASANLDLAIPGWVPPIVDEMAGAKGDGTRVHELLEQAGQMSASDIRHLATILEYLANLRATRRFKVLAEETIEATWLTSKPKTQVDLVLYTQDELHVLDYKWGKILVDVIDNEQLMFYAVCFAPLAPKAKGVTIHILQPRADNMESHFISAQELKDFMLRMQLAESKVLAADLTFGPSDHCKFCPANPHSRGDKGRPLCPAMMRKLYPPVVDETAILDL